MLLTTDKVFLSVVLILSSPLFVVCFFILGDIVVLTILCMYALLSVRLVISDCIFIKSLGYGVASAPLVLLLESNGHRALG